jgi:Diadenosine tetraphosphate (Ap4A) hydrolase and other HIT family hydrolases
MTECVFCGIIDGSIPGNVVYETEDVVAFLDANPVSRGHTLVVPKKHVEDIHGASGMEFLMDALVKVSDAVEEAFDPEGINIAQNNGEAAGQEVFHLHFHVTPIYEGDELEISYNRSELEDGSEIAEEISKYL